MLNVSKLLVGLMACTVLSACTPLVGGTAATSAWISNDPRTTGTVIDDVAIEAKIADAMDDYEYLNLDANSNIHVTSYNNVVLLTGQVPSEAAKLAVGEIAKNTNQVRKVYNELKVGPVTSLTTRSHDSWITTKIKSSSAFHEVNPINTKVITENGVVYLLGLISRDQADKLTELVRTTRGVDRVVRIFEYTD